MLIKGYLLGEQPGEQLEPSFFAERNPLGAYIELRERLYELTVLRARGNTAPIRQSLRRLGIFSASMETLFNQNNRLSLILGVEFQLGFSSHRNSEFMCDLKP